MTLERASSADDRQGGDRTSFLAAGWRQLATRWLLLIACVVCAAGRMWDLRPLEIRWAMLASG